MNQTSFPAYNSEGGAIWARQYLLKASEAKLEA